MSTTPISLQCIYSVLLSPHCFSAKPRPSNGQREGANLCCVSMVALSARPDSAEVTHSSASCASCAGIRDTSMQCQLYASWYTTSRWHPSSIKCSDKQWNRDWEFTHGHGFNAAGFQVAPKRALADASCTRRRANFAESKLQTQSRQVSAASTSSGSGQRSRNSDSG